MRLSRRSLPESQTGLRAKSDVVSDRRPPHEVYQFAAPKVAPSNRGIAARLHKYFRERKHRQETHLTLKMDAQTIAHLQHRARDKALSPEVFAADLLAQALGQEKQRQHAEAALDMLTPREREVTQLAARGFTNAQIAETLIISPETVKTHVRHALAKLGLRSKTDLRLLFKDLGVR